MISVNFHRSSASDNLREGNCRQVIEACPSQHIIAKLSVNLYLWVLKGIIDQKTCQESKFLGYYNFHGLILYIVKMLTIPRCYYDESTREA